MSFENFQPDRERIYRVTSGFRNADGSENVDGGLSAPMPSAIRQDLTGIESLAACHDWYPRVMIPTDKKDINVPDPLKADDKKIKPKDKPVSKNDY